MVLSNWESLNKFLVFSKACLKYLPYFLCSDITVPQDQLDAVSNPQVVCKPFVEATSTQFTTVISSIASTSEPNTVSALTTESMSMLDATTEPAILSESTTMPMNSMTSTAAPTYVPEMTTEPTALLESTGSHLTVHEYRPTLELTEVFESATERTTINESSTEQMPSGNKATQPKSLFDDTTNAMPDRPQFPVTSPHHELLIHSQWRPPICKRSYYGYCTHDIRIYQCKHVAASRLNMSIPLFLQVFHEGRLYIMFLSYLILITESCVVGIVRCAIKEI